MKTITPRKFNIEWDNYVTMDGNCPMEPTIVNGEITLIPSITTHDVLEMVTPLKSVGFGYPC